MEIIFHRYGSICEPDIMEAFQSLGLTVIEEDAEIYQKSIEQHAGRGHSDSSDLLCFQH